MFVHDTAIIEKQTARDSIVLFIIPGFRN